MRRRYLVGGGIAATTLTALLVVPAIAGAQTGGLDEDLVRSDARTALVENLAQLEDQQRTERDRALQELTFPEGTTVGAAHDFDAVRTQIDQIDTGSAWLSHTDQADPAELEWYEPGYFASIVALDWQCAWLSSAVASLASGDSVGVASASTLLRDFRDSDFADAFPDYDYFVAEYVDPLEQGDSSGADAYLGSCRPETLSH
ncbi:MAG: hypothetical protein Q4G64_02650 [bacterium]|nr:hypothetical protein [bacterium]